MDGEVSVPIMWLFAVVGVLMSAFAWWLKTEWSRNWREHDAMKTAAANAHKELDTRIEKHHQQIDGNVRRIHGRIDWLIQHQAGMPPYPQEEDER